MPANVLGAAHRSRPLQRLRRLQPRLGDPAQGPGHRNDRRRRARPARADQPPRPATRRRNAPVVVIDAETGKRWPIWAEIDSTADRPAKADAGDPPGGQLHLRRTATSSPCATSSNAAGEKLEAPGGLPLLPRQRAVRSSRRSTPGAAHFEEIFSTLQKRRDQPQRASTSPGTSPSPATRTTPAASSRCATPPSPSSATPTSPTASSQGSSPSFQVTSVENEPEPGRNRAAGQRHASGALLPVPELRARRHDAARRRTAAPIQNGTWTANFDCIVPDVGDDRPGRIGPALALRARPVRQRRRGRLEPAAEPLPGPRHRPVRDR